MKETKNLEYLYGIHPVTESLISGKRNIKSIIVAKNLSRDINNIRNLSSGKGLPLEFVEKQCLRKILGHDEHQGICASVSGYPYATIDEILEAWAISDRRAFFLILDSIEDSHNLGAIARTALLCGVHGMFIPEHRSAKITPAASKASSGAVEHLKIAVVSSLNSLIGELKKHSIIIAGLAEDGDTELSKLDWKSDIAIIIGSEAKGISITRERACDYLVRIPALKKSFSFNASIAAGIAMYEVMRQRM